MPATPTPAAHHGPTRRAFLAGTGAVAAATLAPTALSRAAAPPTSDRDVLVLIHLRGGADGLSLCIPYGDPNYARLRPVETPTTPGIGVPPPGAPNGCIPLDSFFALPPAMGALKPIFDAGHLAIVHAVGSPDDSRSHFNAQRYMDSALPAESESETGWLGRHLATVDPRDPSAALRAATFGHALPPVLAGGAGWAAMPDSANPDTSTPLARSLKNASTLIRTQPGLETLFIEMGGWDTHSEQGVLRGTMARSMSDLATSLKTFYDETIIGARANVTLVVMSEFGRTLAPNRLNGTDHGRAGAMFLIGRNITGGRVLASWPGLAPDQAALPATIDFRDILAEILAKRMDSTNLAAVFPGYTPTFRNIAV